MVIIYNMKVSIIGAGNVGSSAALLLAEKDICDQIVLVDIVESVRGKAMDINQSSTALGFNTKVIGSTDYEMIKDSDVIVNTAGFPRLKGSGSRDELLEKNMEIAKTVCSNIRKYSPKSIVINVANPVDVLTYAFYKLLGNEPSKVFGMGGLLDCSRAAVLISKETGVSVKDINVIILGTHGDTMVFSKEHTKVDNKQLKDSITDGKVHEIIKKTKFGGSELVSLMGQSGYVAPGACIARQVEAIINDTKEIFCIPALVDGHYGYRGFYIGVPVVLGKNGIEKIVELPLPEDEKKALSEAAKHVKESVSAVEKLK